MDLFDIMHDPDFHSLRDFERLKVLYSMDPNYRALPPQERWKVITTGITDIQKSSLQPAPPPIHNSGAWTPE